jgi:hypothetical protein
MKYNFSRRIEVKFNLLDSLSCLIAVEIYYLKYTLSCKWNVNHVSALFI